MALPDKLPAIYSKPFPYLESEGYVVTSEIDLAYNCIAHAMGDTENWWWPINSPQCYWPSAISREETLACFVKAFETLGYKRCRSAVYEAGYEKVAIYVGKTGIPTHAARQYVDGEFKGTWTSKLGDGYDIRHTTLRGVEGPAYGTVAQIMKRRVLEANT